MTPIKVGRGEKAFGDGGMGGGWSAMGMQPTLLPELQYFNN